MKRLYFFSLLTVIFTLSISHIFAQCSPASPTEAGSHKSVEPYQWQPMTFSGQAGHNYFTFGADTAFTYVFSALAVHFAQVFNIPNNDLQFTILDTLGNAVGGKFGQSFLDDYDVGSSIYEPLMAWSPNYNGNYRLLLTKYQGSGCLPLSSGDSAIVYYSAFRHTQKFAIFHAINSKDWNQSANWMHYTGSGLPQNGKPSDLADYFVLLGGSGSIGKISLVASDSCKNLLFLHSNDSLVIPADRYLKVTDSLWMDGGLSGAGDLIIGTYLDIKSEGFTVKEVIFQGSGNSPEIHESVTGNGYGLEIDTLKIDHTNGLNIGGFFEVNHVKLKRGILKLIPHTQLWHAHAIYIRETSGASSSSYILNNAGFAGLSPHFVRFIIDGTKHSDYIVPIGSANRYRPIRFELIYGDTVNINVAYVEGNANVNMGKEGSLHHVGSLEYWNIFKDPYKASAYSYQYGTSAKVSLSWDAQSGINSSELNSLRVACTDTNSTNWLNRGQTALSTSGQTGWISSIPSAIEKTFVFASANQFHPLPIEDLFLSAVKSEVGIHLTYQVPIISEGSFFIEKSNDGNLFQQEKKVHLGESNWLDQQPFQGGNYYRIKYLSPEGEIQYSAVVKRFWEGNKLDFSISFLSEREIQINYNLEQQLPANMEIFDAFGRICQKEELNPLENTSQILLNELSAGSYWIQLKHNGKMISKPIRLL